METEAFEDVLLKVLQGTNDVGLGSQMSLSQLSQDDNLSNLMEVVSSISAFDLKKTIEKHQKESQLADFVKAIFRGSPCLTKDGLKRRIAVYQEVFSLSSHGILKSSLFNFLLTEIHNLPTTYLAKIVEWILKTTSTQHEKESLGDETENHPFDFLPAVLVRMLTLPRGSVDPDEHCREDLTSLDGARFGEYVIDLLCQQDKWSASENMIYISTMKELADYLSGERAAMIVNKAIAELEHVQTADIAKVASNILVLLATVGPNKGHQIQIDCLNKLIGQLEKHDSDRFVAQGTVVSKFCMLIASDHQLGKSFIKSFSADTSVLRVSMLFGLIRISKLESHVIEVIRSTLRTYVLFQIRSGSSLWYRECLDTAGIDVESLASFNAVILEAVKRSADGGWDCVAQSFPLVADRLMEHNSSYSEHVSYLHDVADDTEVTLLLGHSDVLNSETRSVNAGIAKIGRDIMKASFEKHPVLRREICERMRSRITSSFNPAQGPFQMVRLLGELVDSVPLLISKETVMLKDLVEQIVRITPRTAFGLLRVLKPLFQTRPDLVDFALIVFRKSLFQRELKSRLSALAGFITVAICQDALETQMKVVSCIQRCFSHQSQVKGMLYNGLYVIFQATKYLPVKTSVIDILFRHLDELLIEPLEDTTQKKINEDYAEFPIALQERCIDNASGEVSDPVHLLIEVLIHLSHSNELALSKLLLLRGRFDEYNIVNSIELSSSPNAILLAIYVCQVLIWDKFSTTIWSTMCKLGTLCDDTSKLKQPKKKQKVVDDEVDSFETYPRGAPSILRNVHLSKIISSRSGNDCPSRNFAWKAMSDSLASSFQVDKKQSALLIDGTHLSTCHEVPLMIGGLLQGQSNLETQTVENIGTQVSECLLTEDITKAPVDMFVVLWYFVRIAVESPQTEVLLMSSKLGHLGADVSPEPENVVASCLKTLRNNMCSRLIVMTSKSECVNILIDIMTLLLPLSIDQASEHAEWVRAALDKKPKRSVLDHLIDHHFLSEQLSSPSKHSLKRLFPLSVNLSNYWGHLEELSSGSDDDKTQQGKENMAGLVDSKTAPVIFSCILNFCSNLFDQMDWSLELPDCDALETLICDKLYELLMMVKPIAKSNLPEMKATEKFIKLCLKYYKVIGAFFKNKVGSKQVSDSLLKLGDATKAVTKSLYAECQELSQTTNLTKTIPDLIFQIEQYDVQLLKVSKTIKQLGELRCATKMHGFTCIKKTAEKKKKKRQSTTSQASSGASGSTRN